MTSTTGKFFIRHRQPALILMALALALSPAGCGDPGPLEATPGDAAQAKQAESAGGAGGPLTTNETLAATLAELRQEIEANPEDAARHLRLARILRQARRAEEAIVHFEKAVELQPDASNLFSLAGAYASMSRLHDAEATYHRLLEISPGDPQALNNLGTVALSLGHHERAMGLFRQAIAARPDYILAYSQLAGVQKFYGLFDEAYTTFQTVTRLQPKTPKEQRAQLDAMFQLASIDVIRGAHRRAEQTLARLLQMAPDHPTAHYTRGQALMHLGRQEEAAAEFETHTRLMEQRVPDSPAAMAQ